MRLARIAVFTATTLLASQLLAEEVHVTEVANIAALDEQNGFRGAKFGTPLMQFKNLRLIEDGYWKFFRRTDEVLSFGGGDLLEVGYGFYKDELGAVILKAATANCDSVFEALRASYGQPKQP